MKKKILCLLMACGMLLTACSQKSDVNVKGNVTKNVAETEEQSTEETLEPAILLDMDAIMSNFATGEMTAEYNEDSQSYVFTMPTRHSVVCSVKVLKGINAKTEDEFNTIKDEFVAACGKDKEEFAVLKEESKTDSFYAYAG